MLRAPQNVLFYAIAASAPGTNPKVIKLKIRLFILIALSLLSIQTVQAWTIELSEADLQKKIDKRVPIEKKKLIFTVLVSAIDVELKEGSDRIGLLADMEIRSAHLSSGKGRAVLDGKLDYRPDKGTFYFQEPLVREVTFENIPEKYHSLLKTIFQQAITKRLANTPVYKLDKSKTKHQLAKALLKSVRVVDGRLVLEMGLF